MHIYFSESVGYKTERIVFVNLYGRLCKFLHFNEPLKLNHRLDYFVTSFVYADRMGNVFDTHKQTKLVKFFYDKLSCFVSVHSFVFSAV